MNRNVNMFGRTVPIWFLIMTMVGAGSLAIATTGGAVHQEDAPDIQHTSDAKIHLQDVDGKVITNVPIMANRAFSPLPVEWDEEQNADDITVVDSPSVGSTIATKQKIVLNFVLDVSEDVTPILELDNRSEDPQIFLIKANAPPHVILDFETCNTAGTSPCNPAFSATSDVTVHGLTGHNEWLASIPANAVDGRILMEASTTDAGFFPIVVELLRVG